VSARTAPIEHRPVLNYRWRIVALLFAATTINYVDRSLFGVLGPTLQYNVFHWSDGDFAAISMAFKVAYAIGLLGAGALIDRWGVRVGYFISIVLWGSFSLLHTLVRPSFGLAGFLIARFGLGLGEAGNFPAAIKAVSNWFPAKERALAIGLFNAGSNIGAIIAPLLVVLIVQQSGAGWWWAFVVTGVFSAVWCIVWLSTYREPQHHPRVTADELRWIQSDGVGAMAPPVRSTWWHVIRQPITWGVSVLRLADAAWWFYLFWGGKFLFDQFGLDIKTLALPLILIYLFADIGSISGGWISSRLILRGWSAVGARKCTMLACALLILPVVSATHMGTRFEVNALFFAELARSGTTLTPEQITAISQMQGQSYPSAGYFIVALEKVSAKVPLNPKLEAACIAAARSNRLYWMATLLIALAAAGHQAWAANMYSLIGDYVPKESVASVTGFSGMVGVLAGLMTDFLVGQALTKSGSAGYSAAFLCAGIVYLVVLGLFHLLVPPPTLNQRES
jgi:ACS family hexuronate transporter-like MFS transporter